MAGLPRFSSVGIRCLQSLGYKGITQTMKTSKKSKLNSRRAALDLLSAVLDKNHALDEAFANDAGTAKLEPRDRAFVRNLVTTCIRRLGQIDGLITACLNSPLPKKARVAEHLLRLGVCQLVFLRTPPHAAVDTSVDLAQQLDLGPYKKLINAVLRRVDREALSMIRKQDEGKLNTPKWLWASWQETYGDEVCRKIAAAHLHIAPLDISVKSDSKQWAEQFSAEMMTETTVRLKSSGDVTELPGFDDGEWWVQDIAATVPVKLLGDIQGCHVIDLCAAPGGKTAQLINAGATVTAVDRSKNRLKRLQDNLKRLTMKADVVTADACDWRPETLADMVLLDAPCSATGTIRRHPDLGYLKKPEDVDKLAALQTRLIVAATEMVRSGGKIVYSTCSLEPKECEDQISGVDGLGLKVEKIDPQRISAFSSTITPEGTFRSLPFHLQEQGGMDGFFAAILKKT